MTYTEAVLSENEREAPKRDNNLSTRTEGVLNIAIIPHQLFRLESPKIGLRSL